MHSVALALITHLIKTGALDADDVAAIADMVEDEDAQHLVHCTILDASAPTQSEWEAEQARARFRAISGGKDKTD